MLSRCNLDGGEYGLCVISRDGMLRQDLLHLRQRAAGMLHLWLGHHRSLSAAVCIIQGRPLTGSIPLHEVNDAHASLQISHKVSDIRAARVYSRSVTLVSTNVRILSFLRMT
jgi:hypothetical protein